jgi:hypothetical protein
MKLLRIDGTRYWGLSRQFPKNLDYVSRLQSHVLTDLSFVERAEVDLHHFVVGG